MGRSDEERRERRAGLPPVAGVSPRVLVLGIIPSVLSSRKGQYYGNPLNHFWRLMAEVLEVQMPDDYPGRCEVLTEGGIALWDVLAECRIEGSRDHTILDPVPNDLPRFLSENPDVRHIFVNGKAAHKLFLKFNDGRFSVKVSVLPSSSPANAIKWAVRRQAWMAVRDALRP